MKPIRIAIAALCLASLLSGCATPAPVGLSPSVSMIKPSATYSDARSDIKIWERHNPQPQKERVIGAMFGLTNFTLDNGKTAAELVAGVANKVAPGAKDVKLTRFWTTHTIGMWAGACWSDIAADVTLADERVVTVTGHGKNVAMAATPRNLELAIERALDDFEKHLSMAAAATR